MTYNPMRAALKAKEAIRVNPKVAPEHAGGFTVHVNEGPIICCVLLTSLLSGGPVPDDFQGIAANGGVKAIREHVRPDGAVFIGSFEMQGMKDSLVLVYGPKEMDIRVAERAATQERPVLLRRQDSWKLGPFGNPNAIPSTLPSA